MSWNMDYRPKHIQEADRKANEIATAAADKFVTESLTEVSDERYEKVRWAAYKKAFKELTDQTIPENHDDDDED